MSTSKDTKDPMGTASSTDPANDDVKMSVEFCDDGGRPKIDEYVEPPRYRVGDEVYLRVNRRLVTTATYYVASVQGGMYYTLLNKDNTPFEPGRLFQVGELVGARPLREFGL